MKINLGKEFARYPAGRYRADGPYNGQKFREDFLIPALKGADYEIEINLDNARGLKSSFLEEAFGGLVRDGYEANELLERFKFVTNIDPSLEDEIRKYIKKVQYSMQ